MSLLIDTDAFCKFACGGLLERAIALFGLPAAECARLPALPHMLRRGALHRRLGAALSARLLSESTRLTVAPAPGLQWLNVLKPYTQIDPGEAQLLALAAEHGAFLLTGDKRALQEVRNIPELVRALAGRIAVPEAVLLALCAVHGDEAVRSAAIEAAPLDTMFRVCFSKSEQEPRLAVRSYLDDTRAKLRPLELWELS